MLQVLEQVLENLYTRNNTPDDLKSRAPSPFARKKAIIAHSLYGVEVKRWAVWINQLRLWLTLFVDMPDDFKSSLTPLLPNLAFKVRTGDSLVQRIGSQTFPVQGHADLPRDIKGRITKLKQRKRDFFHNEKTCDYEFIEEEELHIFRAILDMEIKARQEKIRNLLTSPLQQSTLFPSGPQQMELDITMGTKALRDELEAEIAALRVQQKCLRDDRPFIWSIEFAEIFFDRGGFDIIIGNPPYVRQEDITDPNGLLSPREYKGALQEMVLLDFPAYFAHSRARQDQYKKGRKPSGRSDLYTYFYIRSLRLLNSTGVHVFICSNSWLDVGYGTWLQEFFLGQVPLHLVVDNHARRSFTRADINTIITVTGAPKEVPNNHVLRFVAFKKPFADVVLSDNLLEIVEAKTTRRDNRFRVYPITVGELLREGSEAATSRQDEVGTDTIKTGQPGKYVGDKWGGKYLRAPDIFFTILEKGKDKLVRLGDIAEVRRGFTTGANDFFYLEPLGPGSRPGLLRVCNGAGWEGEIEEEFLRPVIKSPRECRSIMVQLEDLRYRLFMCPKDREELKGTKALKYIRWGENFRIRIRQGSKKGQTVTGYHNLQTLKGRERWWDLGVRAIPDLIMVKGPWNRHFVIVNTVKAYCDQQLYEVSFSTDEVASYVAYLSNTTLSGIFFELEGRRTFGEGILWLAAYEIRNVRVLLDKNVNCQHEQRLFKRDIGNVFTECGMDPESKTPLAQQEPNPLPDRKALDDIVFDALDLTLEERKEVYRAVCQLVWERISKARSRR